MKMKRMAPINGGVGLPAGGGRPMGMQGGRKSVGEYITDLDMKKYLNYVVFTQPLKSVLAFDSYNVEGASASGEFKLPWNRPHIGDYAFQELFSWLDEVVKYNHIYWRK